MRTRTLARSLGVATMATLALAGSAQAESGSDVVKVRQPYPLADATRFVVQGERAGAAAAAGAPGANCRMPRPSLSLAPRERAIELRQLSLNPRTCRATFERGVPPKGAEGPVDDKPQSAGSRRSAGPSGGVSAQANGYRYSGYGRAWYRDARNGKIVTAVRSGADWNTSGACIGASNVWFRNSADTASGWDEVSHRWSYINNRCDYVVSSTNAHFRDPSFTGCSGGPQVDSFYNRVRFVGYPNGGIRGSRTSWNEPSCKNVLIAYFALYRR
jgi:hypothetical protein